MPHPWVDTCLLKYGWMSDDSFEIFVTGYLKVDAFSPYIKIELREVAVARCICKKNLLFLIWNAVAMFRPQQTHVYGG